MWTIHLLKNTLSFSKECEDELNEFGKEIYVPGENEVFASDGKFVFNSDHNEWMDVIKNEPKIREILCKHKAVGIACFGDFEGDNQGELWGHAFDRSGKYHKLTGEIIWK